MKRLDLKRYTPPGYTSSLTFLNIFALISATIKTIALPIHITAARNALYHQGRLVLGLIPGAKMAPYRALIGDSFSLFPLFWLLMGLEVVSCYQFFRQGSKSIYLMRRLPDPWELHRRCWGRPLIYTAGSLVLMGGILVFYYLLYLLLTPKGCLPY